jgi:two-component system LytT family sensor kinase
MQRRKTSYIVEFLIHTVFWLGVYYALKGLAASSFQILVSNNGGEMRQDGRMLFPYPWIVLVFLMLLFYSSSFWLFRKKIAYRIGLYAGWLIVVYLLNFLVINLLSVQAGMMPRHPGAIIPGLPPLPPQTAGFSAENWWEMQPVIALLFILVLGVAVAYFYIGESIRNELTRSQAEAHQASTELRLLRSQVNPHFLFNILNNLFSMAQRDGKDDVADKIAKLSGMMRYMIYDSSTDSVPLEKEISYLEDCIALHQMRYVGNQVDISFRYPDDAAIAQVQLAPMLLIPFLENAFKHGVYARHHSYIAMEITIDQKRLIFTCENIDYSDIKKAVLEKGGIGLENVKRRLELLYPRRHKLILGSENGIYKVNLEIDLA